MQGGLHPQFKLDWYEDLLHDIKRHFPQVNVHGFSPPEIHHFTKVSKLPLRTVLERLRTAGLGSLPGGGGEILVDRVRGAMTRGKVMTDDWLNVHRVWHELGGRSTATMMFGHIETLAERIETLDRLRRLQDETGGFTAYICWTFQPEHTDMADIPAAGAFEYLKTQAVSRLYLDNFPNIQSSWVTQGLKTGQLALLFGANDMGSLMIEENVVSAAGTVHHLTIDEIRGAIAELGYTPRRRNVFYELVERAGDRLGAAYRLGANSDIRRKALARESARRGPPIAISCPEQSLAGAFGLVGSLPAPAASAPFAQAAKSALSYAVGGFGYGGGPILSDISGRSRSADPRAAP